MLHLLMKEEKSISKRLENACFFMDALPILNEKVASAESKENTLEAYEDIIDKLKKQTIS